MGWLLLALAPSGPLHRAPTPLQRASLFARSVHSNCAACGKCSGRKRRECFPKPVAIGDVLLLQGFEDGEDVFSLACWMS